MENVTPSSVLNLDKHLRSRGVSKTTLGKYMVMLSAVLGYAEKSGYVNFRIRPFSTYKIPKPEIRQAWLSVEEVRKIRDLEITKYRLRKCRDLFMLSYYLGGMNIIDLLSVNFNKQTEILHYIRRKTEDRLKVNKFVEFTIPEEARIIINRYKGKDGFLEVTPFQRKSCLKRFFGIYLDKIAKLTGIQNLIYYSARKSFSQHAFNLGISTSTIDYILGHKLDKGGTSLYAYIYVTPEMATEAIRKVLDNLK